MKIRFRQSQFFLSSAAFSPLPTLVPEAVPPPFVSPRIFRPDVPLLFSQSRRNGKDSDTAPISPSFNPLFLLRFSFQKRKSLLCLCLCLFFYRQIGGCFSNVSAAVRCCFLHLPLQTTLLSPTGRHGSFYMPAQLFLSFLFSSIRFNAVSAVSRRRKAP